MSHRNKGPNLQLNKRAISFGRLAAFHKPPPSVKPSVQSRKLQILSSL